MSAETIAASLTRDITDGAFPPGSDLLQADLAKRFNVSRIPIRDALQRLAVDGLVTVVPNRGARVISLTPDEIRETYDLRILLEGDILARAIPNMTEEDLARIDIALEKSNLDAKTKNWAAGDWDFHKTLYAPAKRPQQLAIIGTLRRTCQVHIAAYRKLPDQTPRWLNDHEAIVEQCRKRNARKACAILKVHLQRACGTLMAAMPTA